MGTTDFYVPPGASVHGLIVRQLASTSQFVRTEELAHVHYQCKSKRGAATSSTLEGFVCAARLNVTPPGLPSGGQTQSYIWELKFVGTIPSIEVEVWLCATCT